jgi:hypothetical protein
MQSDCVDLGQQITIYRLKPVDGEILIEETDTVIYVIVTIAEEFIYSDCEKAINAIYLKFWIDT